MKCQNRWNYRPYTPADRFEERALPYICRLAPGRDFLDVEWFDNGCDGTHRLHYAQFPDGPEQVLEVPAHGQTRLRNLLADTEYQIRLTDRTGRQSHCRRFRTGEVPCNSVVCYLHPEDDIFRFSGQYPCSPSVVRLPSGALLVSNDYYISQGPQNYTTIFRSEDNGKTWFYVTDLMPCFWGKLFWHRNALYMLGMSTEYGDLLIGRSDDEGVTWSTPVVLMRGSCNPSYNGLHKAPMRIEHAAGRLWTGIDYGSWAHKCFANSLFSVPEDADLLDVSAWSCTGFLPHDPTLPLGDKQMGAIEGNAISAPDGKIVNLLRYAEGKAKLTVTDPQKPEELPLCHGIIDFPMGHSKFELLRGDNGCYYAVGNLPPMRNRLSLISSADLVHWEFERDLVDATAFDIKKNAFQYPAALLEGNQLTVISRTAFNGACSWHNSNYITCHCFTIS